MEIYPLVNYNPNTLIAPSNFQTEFSGNFSFLIEASDIFHSFPINIYLIYFPSFFHFVESFFFFFFFFDLLYSVLPLLPSTLFQNVCFSIRRLSTDYFNRKKYILHPHSSNEEEFFVDRRKIALFCNFPRLRVISFRSQESNTAVLSIQVFTCHANVIYMSTICIFRDDTSLVPSDFLA